MHYLIGRDLDADGHYEFIQDMANMILTEDPYRALQVTEYDLTYIDMAYLNEYGFYALEASRFQVSLLERLLFRPIVRGFRPRIAPPPRRAPRPRGLFGLRKPHPRPQAPKPPRAIHRAPAPAPARGMGVPKPRPDGPVSRGPSRSGMAAPKHRPGPGGRGGRGFGR